LELVLDVIIIFIYKYSFGVVLCFICYYLCLYLFSIGGIAASMGTRIPDFFFWIFTSYRAISFIVVCPFIALLPDITYKFLFQNTLFLKPADVIKKIELQAIK
jgi:hypothetical protein